MFSYLFQHFSKKFTLKNKAQPLKPAIVHAEQKAPPSSGETQIYYFDNKTREIPSLTTEYSKTRYLENGQMEITAFTTPHYYQDEKGKWQDIDMNIEGGKIKHGIYQAELLKDGYGYTIRHREDKGSITVKLKSIGGGGYSPFINNPSSMGIKHVGSKLFRGLI